MAGRAFERGRKGPFGRISERGTEYLHTGVRSVNQNRPGRWDPSCSSNLNKNAPVPKRRQRRTPLRYHSNSVRENTRRSKPCNGGDRPGLLTVQPDRSEVMCSPHSPPPCTKRRLSGREHTVTCPLPSVSLGILSAFTGNVKGEVHEKTVDNRRPYGYNKTVRALLQGS